MLINFWRCFDFRSSWSLLFEKKTIHASQKVSTGLPAAQLLHLGRQSHYQLGQLFGHVAGLIGFGIFPLDLVLFQTVPWEQDIHSLSTAQAAKTDAKRTVAKAQGGFDKNGRNNVKEAKNHLPLGGSHDVSLAAKDNSHFAYLKLATRQLNHRYRHFNNQNFAKRQSPSNTRRRGRIPHPHHR